MESSKVTSLFAEALVLHQTGQLTEAEQIYNRILAKQPDHFDSLHLLGVIFHQRGDHALAVHQIDKALKVNSDIFSPKRSGVTNQDLKRYADALYNRGNALYELRRFEEALASYDHAVAVRPDYAEALSNRGNSLKELKRYGKAMASYRRALAVRPHYPEALLNRGATLHEMKRFEEALVCYDSVLGQQPDHAEAFLNRGATLHEMKRFDEALASYDRALAVQPNYADALYNRGNALRELKRNDEALASYESALTLRPGYAEGFLNRGATLHELGRYEEALTSYDHALRLQPDLTEAWSNRGNALKELGRHEEALASYDRALALQPNHAEALLNRGATLHELKRFAEALPSYTRALKLRPNKAEVFLSRGVTLHELKRYREALASYNRALVIRPDYAEAFVNRGATLHQLKRLDEALASCDRALTLRPDYAEALLNRGVTLNELKRFEEALASYDRALMLRPDSVETLSNRGNTLKELKRFKEALASYDRALMLRPDYAAALLNRGITLHEVKRFDEALASYDRALAVDPNNAQAFNGTMDCVSRLCDWDRRRDIADKLVTHILERNSAILPFALLGYSDDRALQLQCAKNFVTNCVSQFTQPLWRGETWRHGKVRIAYLSADFRQHAIAFLLAELIERHDRSRFEIIGVSFGGDSKSEMRQRLVAAFDHFHDVGPKNDEEVARLLRALQVDIAVDLMGYTQNSRFGILARRPAPIQVSYLGFPATMGAAFIDYLIADGTVAPFEHQPFYIEKIVHLPNCYQVNDTTRKIAARTPSRHEAGLPETGFVFCCFNNNWKITPDVFSVWMRLLRTVEGSVLWLLSDNKTAERNLRSQAQDRDIDPARLVFANRLPLEDHLARHRLADLFLDTLPYNAHTTASDALWAGLPVVTPLGESFAGRVAASLLKAIGLPELVTHSIDDYEALALRLANNPEFLKSYRNQLTKNRLTYPLFDTDRFRRHIETAYLQMWEIWQRGERPRSFAVEEEPDDKLVQL
jgi:protein O-GlcNAc transferase